MKLPTRLDRDYHVLMAGIFALVASLVTAAPAADDALQTFSSTGNGFTVQVPAEWHRVSDASVQKALATAAERDPSKRDVIWDAVFQRPAEEKAGQFGYPYIICQVTPYPGGKRPGEAEIADAVKAMVAMDVTTGRSTVTYGAARYDAATHVAWQSRQLNAPTGVVKGHSVMHYGGKAIVAIMFYDVAASFDADKAVLDQIESSFKFDAAAAYGPGDATKPNVPAAALMQTGELDFTFTERSPLSSRKEIGRRLSMKEETLGPDYDLTQRPFKAYVPQNYDPKVPHGVFVYLGYKDSTSLPSAWEPVLDKAHMIFITPVNHHGDKYPNSIPSWETVGLALDAVHNLKQRYNLDASRVYRMSHGEDSMRFSLASADVFTGFVVTGDYTWYEQIVLPDRRIYERKFLPPPSELLAQARRRPFILATEDFGPPTGSWHARTPAMKRDGFAHVLELKLTWLGDLHYPMLKPEWLETSALPFLDGIATQGPKSKPARTPDTTASGPATAPADPATPAAPNADAQHLLTLAQLYINNKDPKRAREKLELLLRHYPNDPVAAKAKEMLSGLPTE